MKKTYLTLVLLITGFFFVGNAYAGDEVYYCAESYSYSFSYDNKNESYVPQKKKLSKFKIKLDKPGKETISKGKGGPFTMFQQGEIELAPENGPREKYGCKYPFKHIKQTKFAGKEFISCEGNKDANYFGIEIKTGRFEYLQGSGYILEGSAGIKSHPVYFSVGKCDKF